MSVKKPFRVFTILVFALAAVWTIGAAQIVQASTPLPQGTLAKEEVIDNDVFVTGEKVSLDGSVLGDAFILGNQVSIEGTVDGSLFVIGQQVDIQGTVAGTTYVAALSLELGSESVLQRNLYFLGASLSTLPGSEIQRDLKTICLSADLKGDVTRDTRATIGILKLVQSVIKLFGGDILIPRPSILPGASVSPRLLGGLFSSLLTPYYQEPVASGGIDTAKLSEWSLARLRDFVVLLFLGAVFFWLGREPLKRTNQALRNRPLRGLGYGLLGLFITLNLILVCLLLASLFFVIGLWLGNLGFWVFSAALWALTFAAIVFSIAVIWIVVAYGTKLAVAYLAGNWFFEKIAPKASISPFVGLALGILVYVLLRSIPMLGWVLGVLVTAWGLGGFWLAYRNPADQPELLE